MGCQRLCGHSVSSRWGPRVVYTTGSLVMVQPMSPLAIWNANCWQFHSLLAWAGGIGNNPHWNGAIDEPELAVGFRGISSTGHRHCLWAVALVLASLVVVHSPNT